MLVKKQGDQHALGPHPVAFTERSQIEAFSSPAEITALQQDEKNPTSVLHKNLSGLFNTSILEEGAAYCSKTKQLKLQEKMNSF